MEKDEASAAVDFVAGTVGGIASLLAGHPFDTIKTRLQAQSHSSSSVLNTSSSSAPLIPRYTASFHYTSSWDALRRIVAEERFIGLYKGVTSPMLGVAIMNASVFGVYGLALRKLQGEDDQRGSLQAIFLAGCISGVVSAFITSPIDLIKIRQQLSHTTKEPGTMQVIKGIYTQGGVRGLYRGLGCTCIRDLGYGPYFLSYEVFNQLLLTTKSYSEDPPILTNIDFAISGGFAGLLAWVSTFGADVVKTRVQATNRIPGVKFAFASAARDIYREGGWKSFFAGIGPTVLRALPVNAVLFITFEATRDLLRGKGY